MAEPRQFTVHGDNGLKGVVFASARFLDPNSERVVKLDNGTELRVPANALEPRPDGSFYLHLGPKDIPGRRTAGEPAGEAHSEPHSAPMFRESYEVERIGVDRLLDEMPLERKEGDALVLPVIEEVLVVEKKYLLKEEIWIHKRREQLSEVRRVHVTAEKGKDGRGKGSS